MGYYPYQCKKLRVELNQFKKICYSQSSADTTIATANSEDEDCCDVLMVSKCTSSIKNLWVSDYACFFHICWNKDWFNMYNTCC